MPTITSTDIRYQVRTAVEAAGDEAHGIDIEGIVDEIVLVHGLVDVDSIDHDTFWAIVARHDATQPVSPADVARLLVEAGVDDDRHDLSVDPVGVLWVDRYTDQAIVMGSNGDDPSWWDYTVYGPESAIERTDGGRLPYVVVAVADLVIDS